MMKPQLTHIKSKLLQNKKWARNIYLTNLGMIKATNSNEDIWWCCGVPEMTSGQGSRPLPLTLSTPSFWKLTCSLLKFCIYSCSSFVLNFTCFRGICPETNQKTKHKLGNEIGFVLFAVLPWTAKHEYGPWELFIRCRIQRNGMKTEC